jgi:hypothetical protein
MNMPSCRRRATPILLLLVALTVPSVAAAASAAENLPDKLWATMTIEAPNRPALSTPVMDWTHGVQSILRADQPRAGARELLPLVVTAPLWNPTELFRAAAQGAPLTITIDILDSTARVVHRARFRDARVASVRRVVEKGAFAVRAEFAYAIVDFNPGAPDEFTEGAKYVR